MTSLRTAFSINAPFGGTLIFWAFGSSPHSLSFSFSEKILDKETHLDIKNALVGYLKNQQPIACEIGKKLLSARDELSDFQKNILLYMLEIPFAETISYQDLAIAAGEKASAARAVGNACNKNPFPIFIPCHRVIPKDGKVGNFAWGGAAKVWLLTQEQAACSNRV